MTVHIPGVRLEDLSSEALVIPTFKQERRHKHFLELGIEFEATLRIHPVASRQLLIGSAAGGVIAQRLGVPFDSRLVEQVSQRFGQQRVLVQTQRQANRLVVRQRAVGLQQFQLVNQRRLHLGCFQEP